MLAAIQAAKEALAAYSAKLAVHQGDNLINPAEHAELTALKATYDQTKAAAVDAVAQVPDSSASKPALQAEVNALPNITVPAVDTVHLTLSAADTKRRRGYYGCGQIRSSS